MSRRSSSLVVVIAAVVGYTAMNHPESIVMSSWRSVKRVTTLRRNSSEVVGRDTSLKVLDPPDSTSPDSNRPVALEAETGSNGLTTLRVDVIGVVRIAPLMGNAAELVRAIICYLALQFERPRSRDEIQTAIWPTASTNRDISTKSFLNYISKTRQVIGIGHLPEARRGRYLLEGVASDLEDFRALAARSRKEEPSMRRRLRHDALKLVRGEPFESESSKYFSWARDEGLVASIIDEITTLAHEQAIDLLEAGALDEAEWSIRQGLLVSRFEVVLWEDLSDVARLREGRNTLERVLRQAEAVLGNEAARLLRMRVHG